MRLLDRLNGAQRIVAVIALGLALSAVGSYLASLGGRGLAAGWYAYAPLTSQAYAPATGLPAWLRMIIWLALITLWALASIRILRPARDQDGSS